MPTIWISRRTLALGAILVTALIGAWIMYPTFANDAAILDPAKRVAVALATGDLYAAPAQFKDDLAPAAYQQTLVRATPSAIAQGAPTAKPTFVKFGATLILDRDVLAPGKTTALVQTFIRADKTAPIKLVETQFALTRDGNHWRVERVLDYLDKGEVNAK